MKKLLLFTLFISALFSAQNRFIYEYKFVPDSTSSENVEKELMYLDITKNGSVYYSRDVFVRDSTMHAEMDKQMKAGNFNIDLKSVGNKGKVGYKVTKNYPKNKVYLNTRIASDPYKVLEDRVLDWKILPEKQKIGEFEAQKATTEFAGRKWIAWFSEELPFNDGPYKFRGLPGLIVKIEDITNSHSMELKASTKFVVSEEKEISDASTSGERRVVVIGDSFSKGKEEVEIDRKQQKKLFWEDREDPAKALKVMGSRDGVEMKFKDQNGNEISMNDMIRKREEAAKEAIKRNNNILELDLLKK